MADTSLIFNIIGRDKASGSFNKVSNRAKILGAAIGALAVKVGKDSVAAYVDAEKAQTRLADAFAKFPALADTNIGRLRALNTALAQKTRFDDDATASGQAVLAQFGLTGKQLESLTPLLQDYAAKTGQDMPTAATAFGKALLGNTRALKSIGINYKMTGNATQDYANITELMRQKVGGFAAKEGKTAAGQAAILRNQFGELEESLGSKLVPALVKLAGVLLTVIDFIQRNQSVVVPLAAGLGTLAAAIWTVNKAAKAYTAVQAALNLVMALNPIGLVVIAIALLVAGMVIAWKKSETFRSVVTKVFVTVASAVLSMADTWLAALGSIFGVLGKLPGKLGAPFRAAESAIDKARGKVAQFQAELNRLKSKSVTVKVFGAGEARAQVMALNAALRATSGAHVSIGGVGTGISDGRRMAEGGIVKARRGGTSAILAEAGHDEAVIPLSGPNAPRWGGGGDVMQPIHIYLDSDMVLKAMVKSQRKHGGSLPMLRTS